MASSYPSPPSTSSFRSRVHDTSPEGYRLGITTQVPSYTIERYRVGIPALQLLPLHSSPLHPTSSVVGRITQVHLQIRHILNSHGIAFDETEVVHRTLPGIAASEDDRTFLVHAQWEDDGDITHWFNATKALRDLFHGHFTTTTVKVELLGWQLVRPRKIAIVEATHPLVAAWPVVNAEIHRIIEHSPALSDAWHTIDVLRTGFKSEEYSPMPVTISITVDWSLNFEHWVSPEYDIVSYLSTHGNLDDVCVTFERGELDLNAFPLLSPSRPAAGPHEYIAGDYPVRVPMGSDFGPEKYFTLSPGGELLNDPTGTIGGYIEVQVQNRPWEKFAVTNYHCIRHAIPGWSTIEGPNKALVGAKVPDKSMLHVLDLNGAGPNYAGLQQILPFASPSRRKHNFSLQFHDDEIKKITAALQDSPGNPQIMTALSDHQEAKARKLAYFDQGRHHFGKLFLCSGFGTRSKNNGRIDIALLRVHHQKMGSNMVPHQSAWKDFQPPLTACGQMLVDIDSWNRQAALGRTFKIGSRSGATTGQFSHIKSDVKMKEWDPQYGFPYSTEYCFVADPLGFGRVFQTHGDSGAFNFTTLAKWLGVSFGGNGKHNVSDQALGYVTDAQDIIDWINNLKDGNTYKARLATF